MEKEILKFSAYTLRNKDGEYASSKMYSKTLYREELLTSSLQYAYVFPTKFEAENAKRYLREVWNAEVELCKFRLSFEQAD